jgi:hypothetical protein
MMMARLPASRAASTSVTIALIDHGQDGDIAALLARHQHVFRHANLPLIYFDSIL